MIMQGTPFASIIAMARNSIGLVTDNLCPVLVLVSEIPSESAGRFAAQQVTEIDSLAVHQTEALRQVPAHGLVYFVRKRESGVVRDRIGIGRDHNADIWVPTPKISRYHAFFSTAIQSSWTLTDANSKNGSRIAGNRLAAGASYVLPETSPITLGGIEFNFYLPESFLALCQSFL